MLGILRTVNRHLTIAIPTAMAAGFVLGVYFDAAPLKGLIPYFTFLMVFPMMVTLRYRELFTSCAFRTQGLTQFFNLALIPVIGYLLGRLFFADSPHLALGLLLAAVIPTSGMTVSWTGFARGNVEVAVKMMIIGRPWDPCSPPFT